MEDWGWKFQKEVAQRSEGQSDFALDLIDLLKQKAKEFNEQAPGDYKFAILVRTKGEDVDVTNGYKSASAFTSVLPGAIFLRVVTTGDIVNRAFEAMLRNTPSGFEPDGLPRECGDPEGLAEWMLHEIFEP